ncbi:hypothetical protein PoB_004621500 [Plakobranchus ocellatus]|uniref:Uncharacterized protein n=1 Tax=Plakobranchus ocellatus TaxID=259542 RepID=A0AAV4BKY7_9GAST|nr:hypothetical protein PoB_004621500 [Plakobranchus ocellatus]
MCNELRPEVDQTKGRPPCGQKPRNPSQLGPIVLEDFKVEPGPDRAEKKALLGIETRKRLRGRAVCSAWRALLCAQNLITSLCLDKPGRA